MVDKVFSISGNKISSFITDEGSLKFSSQKFNTVSEFQEAWNKKVSLATKFDVEYDAIKSITKEDNDKDILIKYKAWAGMPGACEFSFSTFTDCEIFFSFLEKERYFKRTQETLTPIKAIKNYLIGFIATIGITVFSYYQALNIANGTAENADNGKARVFNFVVGLLGDKGVMAVGLSISCFLFYKIWTRFSNPPNQTKFLPPNT